MEIGFSNQRCDKWTNSNVVNKNLVLDPNQGVKEMELPRHMWSVQ